MLAELLPKLFQMGQMNQSGAPPVGAARLGVLWYGMRILVISSALVCSVCSISITASAKSPSDSTGASLRREALKLVPKVAKMRGLRQKRKVRMGVVNKEQLLFRINERIKEHYSEEDIAIDQAVLWRLGLIPKTLDYKQAILKLLTDQIAGFYDPKDAELRIADWIPADMQRPALVHELCHALQDQHFRLKRFVKPIKDNGDRQLALTALIEGDCTGLMLEYLLAKTGKDLQSVGPHLETMVQTAMSAASSETFSQAPLFMRKTLTFPYIFGLRFVASLRAKRPWSALNRVFRRTPQSTEQIIHPEKYWRRERPVKVKAKPLKSLTDYRQVKQDTLGEYQLRLFLRQQLDADISERAAAGWGGDRYAVYFAEGDLKTPLLLLLTTWDSALDAKEFFSASSRSLLKMFPQKAEGTPSTYVDPEGKQARAELKGKAVLLLIGLPAELTENVREEIWKTWRIKGRRIR
jgi:hypothetical protein